MYLDLKVVIKGAGEMASGVAHRLARCHFKVAMLDIARPLAVRRRVCFSEAVFSGRAEVQGITAVLAASAAEAEEAWARGEIAVLVDPAMESLAALGPDVLVEATLSKRNTGIGQDTAPLVIALGPGYTAGVDCHVAIETCRGHHLGRVYDEGPTLPNTGIPGEIAGLTHQRVLRAPADGVFTTGLDLGDRVEEGREVARVEGIPIAAGCSGILRGLLRSGTPVTRGLKVGDVDPRGQYDHLDTISEKARAVGGSVLEAILNRYNR